MKDYQVELQMRSDDLNRLQEELRSNILARQQLESQQQENKSVQKEFSSLADDATIFKLIGPALVKQDKAEAALAVDRRLEFIQKEIERIEKQIAELQTKSEQQKAEIFQLQTQFQQQQQQQQPKQQPKPIAGTA